MIIEKRIKKTLEKVIIPIDETVGKLRTLTREEDRKIAKLFGRRPHLK